MRIIAGRLRHRKIVFPQNLPIRATTDMAKEAIFNIIQSRYFFEDLRVLDLFAGSGAISYEFVSRNAPHITAVDSNPLCVSFIKKTVADLGISQISVVRNDAFRFLENCKPQFDIIFADPPYDFTIEKYNQLIELALKNSLATNSDALFVLEHSKELHIDGFSREPLEVRSYGSVNFSLFKN